MPDPARAIGQQPTYNALDEGVRPHSVPQFIAHQCQGEATVSPCSQPIQMAGATIMGLSDEESGAHHYRALMLERDVLGCDARVSVVCQWIRRRVLAVWTGIA